MVRQVRPHRRPASWKAALAITIAAAGLLWHLLACLESPMAFSPDGKELAFTTMEPFDENFQDTFALAGPHCYRLMVLRDFEHLRVVEQSTDHVISGPAYSPDGKQICYLRLPLLSPEQSEKAKRTIRERIKAWEALGDPAPAAPATTRPGGVESGQESTLALPSPEDAARFARMAKIVPPLQIEVVVRDTRTLGIIARVQTRVIPRWRPPDHTPEPAAKMKTIAAAYYRAYISTRPQYGPKGKWVYFCAGGTAMGVNPTTKVVKTLAAPADAAAISPDGKTLAVHRGNVIGFIRTDGRSATYHRRGRKPLGLTWTDARTLAVLSTYKVKERHGYVLESLRTDGTPAGSVQLDAAPAKGEDIGQLALSPDGQHMVLAYAHNVPALVFLDARGRLLKRAKGMVKSMLMEPTFTPDSRHVVVKRMTGETKDNLRVAELIKFTAAGEEVKRVAVPKIKTGTTRPAKATTRPKGD